MFYELHTYDLKAGTQHKYEQLFEQAYEKRRKYSAMAAFWHTEFGLLNQVVHVWPYESYEEREQVRAAVEKDKVWPDALGEHILGQQVDIMTPLAISPRLQSGSLGPYFEMRIYTYMSGGLPLLINNWEKALDVRLQFGPVCALWISEAGALNKFIHIWPYRTLDDRICIRHEAEATGLFPPNARAVKEGGKAYPMHRQENKLLMPARFSPLQ
jgi:hypothetical protein